MDNGFNCYRRFLNGDNDGLAEIIKEYNDGLTLYLNGFVNNITVADELSEETFVKLGLKRPRFSAKSSFKTWLYAIGRNTALDYLRKAAKNKCVPLDDSAAVSDLESLEKTVLKDEKRITVHKALEKLKPEYRQVLWLIYFEELSAADAAKIMKKSVHNIETLSYRARQSLRSQLEEEGYTYENL